MISHDDNGALKEITFHHWCRIVAQHAQASGTATEHADYTTEQNTKRYKSLAIEMLEVLTTPEQRRQSKYKIQHNMRTGEVRITNKQRSWINAMLFKNFGETNVAYFILNHGIPAILDVPLRRKALTKAMFKNMLEELMIWHASFLQCLIDRQENPDMKHVRRLSALNEQKWQRQRREEKKKAQQRIDGGVRLSMQRDSRKRKFEEMSATEQQILENYDTRKTHKDHAKASGTRIPQFRGKMILR